jgi:hypothetical protein
MNKSWFYLGLIGLAILTTSCGDSQPPTPAASPAPIPTPAAAVPSTVPAKPVAAAPATPAATTSATDAAKPADASKTVAIKPVSVDVAAGLIAPTDGESWAKTVAKGRPDPFGMLALQPVEIIEPIDPLAVKQPVAKIAPLTPIATAKQPAVKIATNIEPVIKSVATKPSKSSAIKVAAVPTKAIKVASNKKVASNGKDPNVRLSSIPRTGVNVPLPKIVVALKDPVITKPKTVVKPVSSSKIAAKPAQNSSAKVATTTALPAKNQIAAKAEKVAEKPLQAMAIDISGVIEVEGRTQVIIKLPTESFSRYISVGDRIGNGKVLVKRVEGQSSLSPTVILEEVGVEVPRKIGEISNPTPATPATGANDATPATPAITITPPTKTP